MIKQFGIIFFLFFLISCKKDPPVSSGIHIAENEILAIGHGGSGIGRKYPINTLESVMECFEFGADGSEIDIQMTMDFVLVAFHDKTMDEITNCSGFINEKNWSEIENCAYNSILRDKIQVRKVEDIFNSTENLQDHYFTFDCKLYAKTGKYQVYLNQYADAIINIIDKYKMDGRVLIESHNTVFLKTLLSKRTGLKLFIYPQSFDEGLKIAKELRLFGISLDSDKITREQIEMAHSNGFQVAIWNVQTQHQNKAGIKKNPDYIQTDKIRHLVKYLGNKQSQPLH